MFGSSNVIGALEDFHIHKIPKNGFDKSSFFYLRLSTIFRFSVFEKTFLCLKNT